MNKHLMFSYGANTNYEHMAIKCPGAIKVCLAELYNHRVAFRYHADIEEHHESTTVGVIWEIDDNHLERLDMYEDHPRYYVRKHANVRPFAYSIEQPDILDKYRDVDDKFIDVIMYGMANKTHRGIPDRHYFDICYNGYVQNGMDIVPLSDAILSCDIRVKLHRHGISF